MFSDERWKDSYDAWKLATPPEYDGPDDEDYEEDPPCCHEDYDLDILTGVTECQSCGHRWTMTSAQIERHYARERDWHESARCMGCQPRPVGFAAEPADDEIPF
jgi:hypothetical protein